MLYIGSLSIKFSKNSKEKSSIHCYPTAIPAKFGWGMVRVKHSNILIVICTYCKCLNALFCVNLPLFCKVDKASIIFFSRIVCYISGHCLSNFQKTQRRNQGIFPAIKRFTIPSDKNAHALVPSLSGMDMTYKF